MRKLSLVCVVALAPLLGGCLLDDLLNKSQISVFAGGTSVTASVSNPVTPQMLYEAESALSIAVSGMQGYKNLCVAGSIPRSCRDVVVLLQGYTRRARPLLVSVRRYLRNNDQVNAISAFNEARLLVSAFQQSAAVYNIKGS